MRIANQGNLAAAVRTSAAYKQAEKRTETPAARPAGDTADVLGIPPAELTPRVRQAIVKLMQEVENLRHELDQSRQRIAYLEELADQDTLAPIANRRAFVREMSRIMAFSERYNSPGSLIFFDVNGLKPINDTHGHQAGDAALVKVADTLLQSVRESDVVGRLGGDEFGVILSNADENQAREKAEALVTLLECEPLDWNGEDIPIGIAYGIYTFRGGDTAVEALAAADEAMYEHKRASRGQ